MTEEHPPVSADVVALRGELEERRRGALAEQVRRFLQPRGDERVLDAGAGTGALAFALAPHVREVVALELAPEIVAEGRRRCTFANIAFVEGDITALPFADGEFDLACCLRTLHHVQRPERAVAELTRVTRLGGCAVLVDQLAPADPLDALELDRFERARDPSHARLLPDVDIRSLLEANGLVVLRTDVVEEERDLVAYLDLAGCSGEARSAAAELAPSRLRVPIGWYLAARRLPRS